MSKVEIIIPIYKKEFSLDEEMSFMQCIKILGNFPIVLVQPEGLDTSYITKLYDKLRIEFFPLKYFDNISGYNELMLSSLFYQRFINTEYILIYQLDAFVFRDDLLFWCDKDYDYIGAPWIATPRNNFIPFLNRLFKKPNLRENIFFKVGNGGFSLRKVSSFIKILNNYHEAIINILEGSNDLYKIEDVFWSLKAPELDKNFRIPNYTEALSFAIDRKPKLAIKLNNNQLPFGCHGFNKPKVRKFWNPILQKYYSNDSLYVF